MRSKFLCRMIMGTVAGLMVTGCSTLPRFERPQAQLNQDKATLEADQEQRLASTVEKIVRRMELVRNGQTQDETYDILLLSGGGDWGVFGAAFLTGWLQNDDMTLPEFDYVAGISTGSLIAAYTTSGEPQRYQEMEQFYLKADETFIHKGSLLDLGLRILGNNVSLLETRRAEVAIDSAIDERLISDLRIAERMDRIVAAGAVNLDLGKFNAFDLTEEVLRHDRPRERISKILRASSAVPGAFPPVEIDGDLYADGGASVGIPIFRVDMVDRVTELWGARNADAMPQIRFWVVFNNKLSVTPRTTKYGWTDVLLRSYKIALQTTLVSPLATLDQAIQSAGGSRYRRAELRWVAIPDSFEDRPEDGPFAPEAMMRLSEIGRRMGRDPGSWRTTVPAH